MTPRGLAGSGFHKEVDRELALAALAAASTAEEAVEFLKVEHGMDIDPRKLTTLATHFCHEQYEELREQINPLKERTLAYNMLDNALYVSNVTQIAVNQLKERLLQGKVSPDSLSRVVRDLGDLQAKSVDKKLALENRPSKIIENRNAAEIIRALEAKGVVKKIEIEQGEVDG